MSRKSTFIASIFVLLILGFGSTSVISYLVANESLAQYIQSNSLAITSDNVHSRVQSDLLQPVTVSAQMAQDTFVQAWVLEGERDSQKIIDYLGAVQRYNNAETAFFVSEQTNNYYHPNGIVRQIDRQGDEDRWYFRVKRLQANFEINLDVDTAASNLTTFFVNHKLFGPEQQFLGIIGVGLASSRLRNMIDKYQTRYDCQVYFVNREGQVVLKGLEFAGDDNIRKSSGIGDIAARVLSSPQGSYVYLRDDRFVFLKAHWISELGWYLLVEQAQVVDASVRRILWINLSISSAVILFVISLVYLAISRYQHQLDRASTTDFLTGVATRHALRPILVQMLNLSKSNRQPISGLLIGIDQLTLINTRYGYSYGDRIVKKVSEVLTTFLASSDVVCRWSGKEFLMLMPGSDLNFTQQVSETIQLEIDQALKQENGISGSIRIHIGVAQYKMNESSSAFFSRLDRVFQQVKAAH